MPKFTKKRKLSFDEIGKCNPSSKSKTRKHCLPKNVYDKISTQTSTKTCDSNQEHCLLDKATGISIDEKEKLRKQYLRPRYPHEWDSDPDEWLDNFNIADVMKQYEYAYPTFRFMGVYPIDFLVQNPRVTNRKQCIHPELCNLNIYTLYNQGVRSFGIIFNLDPHYKGGSHWVSLYCNLNGLKSNSSKDLWCAYFDSYGFDVPNYISIFMRSICSQNKRMKLMYNARRFQYGNSECGMYSMYFIICMLVGISFKEFCKDSVADNFMLKLRHILFTK
jgi:hypothetical protein